MGNISTTALVHRLVTYLGRCSRCKMCRRLRRWGNKDEKVLEVGWKMWREPGGPMTADGNSDVKKCGCSWWHLKTAVMDNDDGGCHKLQLSVTAPGSNNSCLWDLQSQVMARNNGCWHQCRLAMTAFGSFCQWWLKTTVTVTNNRCCQQWWLEMMAACSCDD